VVDVIRNESHGRNFMDLAPMNEGSKFLYEQPSMNRMTG